MTFRVPKILPVLYPSCKWSVNDDNIYLSFDDGPIPDVTHFVLNTLDAFHIKATFFCIGENINKHPETFLDICGRGHRTGNHTMHHTNGWNTKTKDYIEEVSLCQAAINRYNFSSKPKLFRPPYGRISPKQILSLKNDYEIVMWSILSQDYRNDLTPAECLEGTLAAIKPGGIVVFHDSLKAQKNMQYTLPRMIEQLLEKGYKFGLL